MGNLIVGTSHEDYAIPHQISIKSSLTSVTQNTATAGWRVRFVGYCRRASRRPARQLMTLSAILLRDFGATQHVKRAAVPIYKCSISYSMTSSAATIRLCGTVRPDFEQWESGDVKDAAALMKPASEDPRRRSRSSLAPFLPSAVVSSVARSALKPPEFGNIWEGF